MLFTGCSLPLLDHVFLFLSLCLMCRRKREQWKAETQRPLSLITCCSYCVKKIKNKNRAEKRTWFIQNVMETILKKQKCSTTNTEMCEVSDSQKEICQCYFSFFHVGEHKMKPTAQKYACQSMDIFCSNSKMTSRLMPVQPVCSCTVKNIHIIV